MLMESLKGTAEHSGGWLWLLSYFTLKHKALVLLDTIVSTCSIAFVFINYDVH